MDQLSGKDKIVFGVILFLFFAAFATLFGVSIYELTRKQPNEKLLFIGEESTQLRVTSEWLTLYNFYTENIGENLKSYRGEYQVVMNNSSGVEFRVLGDENVIGSSFSLGEKNVKSIVPFTTDDSISVVSLQYKSTHNPVVSRIEIQFD